MLVTLYKIGEMYFRLLGTNGFHVKAEKEKKNKKQLSTPFFFQSGDTPIHFACLSGHYEIVRVLVEKVFKVKSRALARVIINIPNNVSQFDECTTAMMLSCQAWFILAS